MECKGRVKINSNGYSSMLVSVDFLIELTNLADDKIDTIFKKYLSSFKSPTSKGNINLQNKVESLKKDIDGITVDDTEAIELYQYFHERYPTIKDDVKQSCLYNKHILKIKQVIHDYSRYECRLMIDYLVDNYKTDMMFEKVEYPTIDVLHGWRASINRMIKKIDDIRPINEKRLLEYQREADNTDFYIEFMKKNYNLEKKS